MAISLPRVVSAACGRVTINSPHTAGLDNAWQDLILAAIEANVIAPEDRFTLHGLKHRGITDTVGRRAEKKAASGHKSDAMLDLYDHEVAIVEPARPGEAEGSL